MKKTSVSRYGVLVGSVRCKYLNQLVSLDSRILGLIAQPADSETADKVESIIILMIASQR